MDNGDYSLNAWAIHWVARTLPTDPAHLFDAPIFHPHPYTLAYSEPLILQGVLAMPVVWLGGSAVLAYTLVLLAGFALSGWAFAWYTQRLTGSWGAGLVTGSLVAFNAHHLVRLAHIQALHLELLPLVFLALDGLLARQRPRDAVALGLALALQATVSIYLLLFAGWALACAALARIGEWAGHGRWGRAPLLAGAAAAAGLLALPVLWPYMTLAETQGLTRSLADARRCASTGADYLYTGARVHFAWWSHNFRDSVDANFPGIVASALALLALATGGRRQIQIRMWAAVMVGAVVLSIAPRLPGFAALHEAVPALGAIRCYSRAGQIALVGVAVLAGFGAAWLASRVRRDRARAWLLAGLLLAVNGEALRAPFLWVEFPGIPEIYDVLAAEPHAVVAELPFYRRREFFGNARYMLYATRHGHPLLNGYSGFAPADFEPTALTLRRLPALDALELLHRRGVTHVVVHHRAYPAARLRALEQSSGLERMATRDGISIFRLAGAGPAGQVQSPR